MVAPTALAIGPANLPASSTAAIATWTDDLVAEGWTPTIETVPATATVQDVHAMTPGFNHVQLFQGVAVPQVISSQDGHGLVPCDCDAVYATDSLAAWLPDSTGVYQFNGWPSPPVRTVSRLDTTHVGGEAGFAAALARNHAYRTGQAQYDGLAVMVNRFPDSQFPGMTARLVASLETVVGAGNVLNATGQYPDDLFFESYAGRSFLTGALFSGGDPFRQPNGIFGHMYGIGACADAAASQCRIAFLRFFCSHGMNFAAWPMQQALATGVCLACIYDPSGNVALSTWDTTRTFGQAVLPYQHGQTIFTVFGDATLRRREQDMGVSLAQYTADQNAVLARLGATESGLAAVEAQVSALASTGTTTGTAAQIVDATRWAAGTPWTSPHLPVPPPGSAFTAQQFSTIRYADEKIDGPTFSGLTPGRSYTLTFYLCEMGRFAGGLRLLDLMVNNVTVAASVDVFALAGGAFLGLAKSFAVTADATGTVRTQVQATAGAVDRNAYLCGAGLAAVGV